MRGASVQKSRSVITSRSHSAPAMAASRAASALSSATPAPSQPTVMRLDPAAGGPPHQREQTGGVDAA